ncbi:MAG: WYL domain-containing protein, partial [Thermoanaerobaculia bacterium]
SRMARSALAKIEAVLPRGRERLVEETRLYVPTWGEPPGQRIPLGELRRAIRDRRKLRVAYVDEKGNETERTLRPLALAFHPPVWLAITWCELRAAFRSFRLDRIRALEASGETFVEEPGRTLADYLRELEERERAWRAAREVDTGGGARTGVGPASGRAAQSSP